MSCIIYIYVFTDTSLRPCTAIEFRLYLGVGLAVKIITFDHKPQKCMVTQRADSASCAMFSIDFNGRRVTISCNDLDLINNTVSLHTICYALLFVFLSLSLVSHYHWSLCHCLRFQYSAFIFQTPFFW